MSFNLMDLAKGAISNQIKNKIGGILGMDDKAAGGAIETALPALIGGIIKKGSTPSGAGEVFGVLKDHDGGILENLGGIFDGGKQQDSYLEKGQGLLGLIFGGGLNGILGTIGSVIGMKSGLVGKMLSFLAPVVMGLLGKQNKSAGWDISGFSKALEAQKSHLPKMDGGLMNSLGIGDLMGSAKDAVSDTAATVGSAVSGGVDQAANTAGQAASGGMNILKMLLPLILLAALAFLVWRFVISPGGEDPANNNTNPSISVPNIDDLKGQLGGMFTGTTDAITGITDIPSAESARDTINGYTSRLDTLGLSKLPDTMKSTVTEQFLGFSGQLDAPLKKAYEIEGVQNIVKPSIDGMIEKFSFGN